VADPEPQETGGPSAEGTGASRLARRRPLLIAIGCVGAGTLLGAVALPGVLARFEPPAATAGETPPPKPDEGPKGIRLEEPIKVMVNVADEHARRVLKADIIFEAKDAAAKQAITERTVETKHWLIALLSEKRLKELEGGDAKDTLRREIKLCINERLGIPDAILQVYFDQFIVQ